MKTFLTFCLLVGLTGCFQSPVVVAPVAGPVATTLGATQDAQINALRAEVGQKDEVAASAAGNVYGARKALESVAPDQPAKSAAGQELTLAADKLPPASPADQLAAEKRVTATLTGKLEEAKTLYGAAAAEAAKFKAQEAASAQAIADRDTVIARLKVEAVAEQAAQAAALQKLTAAKDQEIADLKGAWTRNTQLWAARGLVAAGILVIVGAAVIVWLSGLAALGKAGGLAVSGLLLIASGLIVGHKYFLPVAGTALGVGIIAGAWYLWHVRQTNKLAQGMMAAVQDVKDAAAAGSEKAKIVADELKANLLYRFPCLPDGNASALETEIDRRLVVDGLNTAQTSTPIIP